MPTTSFTSGNRTYPTFANFGEYLFYSYANLQMLCYAVNAGKKKRDRMCYMIRAKAFKAYKERDGIYMICSKTTLQRYSATTIAGTVERKLSLLNLPKTMFSLEAKAVIFSKAERKERGSIYT